MALSAAQQLSCTAQHSTAAPASLTQARAASQELLLAASKQQRTASAPHRKRWLSAWKEGRPLRSHTPTVAAAAAPATGTRVAANSGPNVGGMRWSKRPVTRRCSSADLPALGRQAREEASTHERSAGGGGAGGAAVTGEFLGLSHLCRPHPPAQRTRPSWGAGRRALSGARWSRAAPRSRPFARAPAAAWAGVLVTGQSMSNEIERGGDSQANLASVQSAQQARQALAAHSQPAQSSPNNAHRHQESVGGRLDRAGQCSGPIVQFGVPR